MPDLSVAGRWSNLRGGCQARLVLLAVSVSCPAQAFSDRSLLDDPGMHHPRLRFNLSALPRPRAPLFAPSQIPGPVSFWKLLQWHKRDMLRPDQPTSPSKGDRDATLGDPSFVFGTRSGESRLEIFAQADPPVYELLSDGGELTSAGGANLFLSAETRRDLSRMDGPIGYQVDLRLTQAHVEATDPRALRDGTVLVQAFSGFVLAYDLPGGKASTLFLQVRHADSRGAQPEYRHCARTRDGRLVLIFAGMPADTQPLAFQPSREPSRIRIDLQRFLMQALQAHFNCDEGFFASALSQPMADPARWRLKEIYLGLETQDRKPSPTPGARAGIARAAVQISGVELTRAP